ncbi:MAG: hypothetical protein JWM78_3117 [Verrucomicrobiaceae bacterium]|nr:hypothetical protein [Verrucomicrobiaceae bacterium]
MAISAIFAFLHFSAVFGIFAIVFFERLTFSKALSFIEAKRIQVCDRWYGLCAVFVLMVGFLRIAYFEKGLTFYTTNTFFYAKITLFIIIGLLSTYPTVRFIKWSPALRQGIAPTVSAKAYKIISLILRTQLILLFAIVLCASFMARGVHF